MPDRGSIKVTVVGTTDVGRIREHNEDNLLVGDLTSGERCESGGEICRELGERGFVVAVADGMGGAASGELASEMAVETVYTALRRGGFREGQSTTHDMAAALTEALASANGEIHERSQSESEHRGMGTTMTAAFLLGKDLAIAQVGDSRGYLLRKGKLVQITKDQSLIEQLIREGTLTREEAEKIGGQNIILQALGVETDVAVDVKTLEILDGDLLVLCSDGLSGMVRDEDIERVAANSGDLTAAAKQLVALANDGGGRDNVTVILARFEGTGLRPPMKPLDAADASGGRGGVGFAPPPRPPVRSSGSRLAIIAAATAIALGLLLFLVLSSGAATLTLTLPAPGARVILTPKEDGEPFVVEMGEDLQRTVPDVPPGEYRLEASIPHYEPLDQPIQVPRGDYPLTVNLRPKPGTVELIPATPRAKVEIRSDVGAVLHSIDLRTMEPHLVQNVPAGPLNIVQVRAGFQSESQKVVLPPEGEIRVPLAELAPKLVSMRLNFGERAAGAQVEIVDEYGEPVWSGAVGADGVVEASMREGEHTMRVRHDRFEPLEESVVVEENVISDFTDRLRPRGGVLEVIGPAGEWIELIQDGKTIRNEQIGPDGRCEFTLPPGQYLVRSTRNGGREPAEVTSLGRTTVELPR